MRSTPSPNPPRIPSGFTMIELLVVILIAGVLAAIAAPGWLGFLENQRLKAANEDAFGAIRLAQSSAIRQRRDYQVSFRFLTANSGTDPEFAIHPTDASSNATALDAADDITAWEPLSENIQLQNTLISSTDATNTSMNTGTSGDYTYYWFAFDYNGNYVDTDGDSVGSGGAGDIDDTPQHFPRVTFSSPSGSNNRRCVTLQTLLGSITLGSDNSPTTNTDQDCQNS